MSQETVLVNLCKYRVRRCHMGLANSGAAELYSLSRKLRTFHLRFYMYFKVFLSGVVELLTVVSNSTAVEWLTCSSAIKAF